MLSHFIIQEIITNSHLEANFDPYELDGQATLTYIHNHPQIRTYLQLTQEEEKNLRNKEVLWSASRAPSIYVKHDDESRQYNN